MKNINNILSVILLLFAGFFVAACDDEETGIAICEVRTVIEAALKETVDAVANGRTLYIRGFGTLSPKHYKRKVARNIHKNETIVIAEHYTPHFKPAKSFKNRTKNL